MSQATEFDTARIGELKRRLDDPRIAAAVAQLLDHADLLADLTVIREASQERFGENPANIDFASMSGSLIAASRKPRNSPGSPTAAPIERIPNGNGAMA